MVTTSQQEEWAQGPFALQAAGGPLLGGPLDTGGDGVLLYFAGADAGAGTRVLPARWPPRTGDLFRPAAPMGGWMVAGSVLVSEATSQAGRPAAWLPLEEEDAFFPRLLTANATGVLWMRSLDQLLAPCLLSPDNGTTDAVHLLHADNRTLVLGVAQRGGDLLGREEGLFVCTLATRGVDSATGELLLPAAASGQAEGSSTWRSTDAVLSRVEGLAGGVLAVRAWPRALQDGSLVVTMCRTEWDGGVVGKGGPVRLTRAFVCASPNATGWQEGDSMQAGCAPLEGFVAHGCVVDWAEARNTSDPFTTAFTRTVTPSAVLLWHLNGTRVQCTSGCGPDTAAVLRASQGQRAWLLGDLAAALEGVWSPRMWSLRRAGSSPPQTGSGFAPLVLLGTPGAQGTVVLCVQLESGALVPLGFPRPWGGDSSAPSQETWGPLGDSTDVPLVLRPAATPSAANSTLSLLAAQRGPESQQLLVGRDTDVKLVLTLSPGGLGDLANLVLISPLQSCGAGQHPGAGGLCELCPPGTWSNSTTGWMPCQSCPPDTFLSSSGGTSPEQCTPCGQPSTVAGKPVCPAGSMADAGAQSSQLMELDKRWQALQTQTGSTPNREGPLRVLESTVSWEAPAPLLFSEIRLDLSLGLWMTPALLISTGLGFLFVYCCYSREGATSKPMGFITSFDMANNFRGRSTLGCGFTLPIYMCFVAGFIFIYWMNGAGNNRYENADPSVVLSSSQGMLDALRVQNATLEFSACLFGTRTQCQPSQVQWWLLAQAHDGGPSVDVTAAALASGATLNVTWAQASRTCCAALALPHGMSTARGSQLGLRVALSHASLFAQGAVFEVVARTPNTTTNLGYSRSSTLLPLEGTLGGQAASHSGAAPVVQNVVFARSLAGDLVMSTRWLPKLFFDCTDAGIKDIFVWETDQASVSCAFNSSASHLVVQPWSVANTVSLAGPAEADGVPQLVLGVDMVRSPVEAVTVLRGQQYEVATLIMRVLFFIFSILNMIQLLYELLMALLKNRFCDPIYNQDSEENGGIVPTDQASYNLESKAGGRAALFTRQRNKHGRRPRSEEEEALLKGEDRL